MSFTDGGVEVEVRELFPPQVACDMGIFIAAIETPSKTVTYQSDL